jgi:hypothetical protein
MSATLYTIENLRRRRKMLAAAVERERERERQQRRDRLNRLLDDWSPDGPEAA